MRKPMTLISIRLHPGILKLADQFAALPPPTNRHGITIGEDSPDTRSDVLRQAIAIGLPLLINPPNRNPKDRKPCPSSAPNLPRTNNVQA